MDVLLPATLVASGEGIPVVCSRHGREPTTVGKCRFVSRPPRWTAVLLLAGALPYLVVVIALRKKVTAPYWPLCNACDQRRRSLLLCGVGTLAASMGLFLLGALLQSHVIMDAPAHARTTADLGIVLLSLSALVFVTGIAIASMAGTRSLAGGVVAPDGMNVEFRNAALPFAQWANDYLNAGQPVSLAPSSYGFAHYSPYGPAPSPSGQAQTAGHGQSSEL